MYGLYRRWQRAGVWARILAGLQGRADALGLITWDVSVDSTIARAHQHAAGARRDSHTQVEPPAGGGSGVVEPADHALGRSRGGLTTKLHLACEQGPCVNPLPLFRFCRTQDSAARCCVVPSLTSVSPSARRRSLSSTSSRRSAADRPVGVPADLVGDDDGVGFGDLLGFADRLGVGLGRTAVGTASRWSEKV